MMNELNTKRDVLSDFSLEDIDDLSYYKAKINTYNFSSAIDYLNDNSINKGIRASIFNTIKNKIVELELHLLNLNADKDVFYSLSEPTEQEMEGKLYWVKPIL